MKIYGLLNYTNDYYKARPLAASAKHNAGWLNALPITSCGLPLDDKAMKEAVSLRLIVDTCQPRTYFCGAALDVKGLYSLSSKRSNG